MTKEQILWWRELGECIRSGEIDKTTSHGKLLRSHYYAEMFSILDIQIDKGG